MRSKVTAVYPRGEETRARILEAALELFAQHGFDGVTTRMIGAAASVPAPSLRYYFENKQGLYAACWNHIQADLLTVMEPALTTAETLLAEKARDRLQLIDAFCGLQEGLFEHVVAGPQAARTALFVARLDLPAGGVQRKPTGGDGTTAYRMLTCFTGLVAAISGDTLDWQSALIVAGLVNAQLATISTKRVGLAEIGIELAGDRLQWLRRTIRQQTTAVLLLHSA